MKFSFETPIKYLNELDKHQDYLFILAHHLEDIKYYNYVKKSKKFKILDNAAYELGESIDIKKYKAFIDDISPNVIILPDKLFDRIRSEKLQKEFKKLFTKEERKKYFFMKVVSANSIKEYFNHLYDIVNDSDVDVIGLSRSRTMITPNLTYIMNWLNDNIVNYKNISKPIHLLGCSHPFELLEAKEFPQIVSIDTGLPINFAFKNKELKNIKRADEFIRISGEDLNTKKKLNIELAKKNIKIFKEIYKNADY